MDSAGSAAAQGATVLALLVPASKRDPLRLVPVAACDPASPNYGQQRKRYAADLRSLVGGYTDKFTIVAETPTQLMGYVLDQAEGHSCNEWWHEAAASATVVSLSDIYGTLVITAEDPRIDTSFRSLSISDWRNDDGGTFAAEEWTDCDLLGPFLLRMLCGYLERLEIQRRMDRRQFPSMLRPDTQDFDDRVTPAQAQVCMACFAANKPLFVCPRCSSVLYCSPECQAAHWPRHQEHCGHMNA